MSHRPDNAVILFDGTNLDGWRQVDGAPAVWEVADGIMTVTQSNIVTLEQFTDAWVHVEWREPDMPDKTGQAKGNSGVYLQGRYEIQVLDSSGWAVPGKGDCGAIYDQFAPLVDANLPALQVANLRHYLPRRPRGRGRPRPEQRAPDRLPERPGHPQQRRDLRPHRRRPRPERRRPRPPAAPGPRRPRQLPQPLAGAPAAWRARTRTSRGRSLRSRRGRIRARRRAKYPAQACGELRDFPEGSRPPGAGYLRAPAADGGRARMRPLPETPTLLPSPPDNPPTPSPPKNPP